MKGFLTALALCAFTTLAYAGPDQAAPMNNAPDSNTQSDMGSMRGMQGMHDAPATMHRSAAHARHGAHASTGSASSSFESDLAECKTLNTADSRNCRREAYAAKAEGLYRR